MQKEQDDCCDMNEKWNKISHLQDVDDKSKHLISDYAKQLVMTDEEFEFDFKKKKEFREKLKTLLK